MREVFRRRAALISALRTRLISRLHANTYDIRAF